MQTGHFLGFLSCLTLCLGSQNLFANQVSLNVSMAQSTLRADQKQTTYVKVGLTGFELPTSKERAAVNVCLVLDKSGSMSGEKIAKAKEAAVSALDRLNTNDIVSVVTYDSTVNVVVPATKLTDRQSIADRIKQIEAEGSTALFAGVSKGAEELRKFLDKEKVNRVILLSDGLANVGPQSPSELAELGESLAKERISVSTIGLGLDYNEDLMTRLASKSDGNHVFVEKSTELVDVFNREFSDVLSVVAQEISIKIHCHDGVRPVRMLNGDAEFLGSDVFVKMNQLYSKQEKYVILEVELPANKDGVKLEVADVSVSYANMETKTTDRLSSNVSVNFSSTASVIGSSINRLVMEQCVLQQANLENMKATQLRDQGDVRGAQLTLQKNAEYLDRFSAELASPALAGRAKENREQAQIVDSEEGYKRGRKLMRAGQYRDATQQRQP